MDAELPDDKGFYRRHLKSCRRLGVEPVPREQVRAFVGDWNRLIRGRLRGGGHQ